MGQWLPHTHPHIYHLAISLLSTFKCVNMYTCVHTQPHTRIFIYLDFNFHYLFANFFFLHGANELSSTHTLSLQ